MIQLRRSFYLKALLAAPIAMMSAPTVEHDGNSNRSNSAADSAATGTVVSATSRLKRTDNLQEDYRDRAYRYRDHDRSYAYYGNGWAHEKKGWTMAGITLNQGEKNNGQP